MPTIKIEMVNIDKIIPYINNAKLHPVEQIDQIAASIKEFGFNDPIAIDGDDVIIEGHGRLLAAQKLGMNKIPIIRLDHLTPAQRKAYTLAHNKLTMNTDFDLDVLRVEIESLLEMDYELDLTGFDEEEIEKLMAEGESPEPVGDVDEVPTIPKKPTTQPGDLYEIGPHRLLCGDSTKLQDVQKLMGAEKADIWITDPPYGVSYKSNGAEDKHRPIENDSKPLGEMQIFWAEVARNILSLTTDKAAYYWFACQGGDQMMMMMMMMMMSLSQAGWRVRHELIWLKDSMVLSRCDYHYKHEPIFYGWKEKGSHEWYGDRKQTSILEFPRPKSSEIHPTMKPVDLIGYLLGNSTKPGDLVVDTFGGSGTTMVAAHQTKRNAFLMEIDPHYCDVIVTRMRNLFPDLPVKRNCEAI